MDKHCGRHLGFWETLIGILEEIRNESGEIINNEIISSCSRTVVYVQSGSDGSVGKLKGDMSLQVR